MSIVYRSLANGAKIPALAFGTGTALYGQDVAKEIIQALETGFTHVDTAQAYRNEKYVGNGISSYLSATSTPRTSIYVTTKFWNKSANETVKDVLSHELADLKLDYVDLYLWHSPTDSVGKLGEIWKQFEEVKKEGLAKEIGISNFRVGDLEELLGSIEKNDGEMPVVHQIEFHPYVLKAALPILEIHKKYGILLASYGGQTPVTKKKDGPVTPILASIVEKWRAQGKEATPGQVLVKWMEARDAIVVTTSSKKSRLQEFLATSELPSLTADEVEEIDEAGKEIHYRGFMKHMDQPRA